MGAIVTVVCFSCKFWVNCEDITSSLAQDVLAFFFVAGKGRDSRDDILGLLGFWG